MIKIYANSPDNYYISTIQIDPKFIAGWYYFDVCGGFKNLAIMTSFGKTFSLFGVPTGELKTEWDLDVGKKRVDAFNHNMKVLESICV